MLVAHRNIRKSHEKFALQCIRRVLNPRLRIYLTGMSGFFFIAMLVAMFLALGSLIVGVISMAKGGEFNRKYGNKLMQARVYMQGLALALFALAMLTSGQQ